MRARQSVPLRQQLLVDQHVQGSLLRRVAFYSVACGVYFLVILVLTEVMSDPDEPFGDALLRCAEESIYWAPGLVLLSPVIAYDLLRTTNRFAGPMFRLRREMQRLVDGESKYPLNFREDDYWTDVAEIFNEVREELHTLREDKVRREREAAEASLPQIASQPQLFTDHESEDLPDGLLMSAEDD